MSTGIGKQIRDLDTYMVCMAGLQHPYSLIEVCTEIMACAETAAAFIVCL